MYLRPTICHCSLRTTTDFTAVPARWAQLDRLRPKGLRQSKLKP